MNPKLCVTNAILDGNFVQQHPNIGPNKSEKVNPESAITILINIGANVAIIIHAIAADGVGFLDLL